MVNDIPTLQIQDAVNIVQQMFGKMLENDDMYAFIIKKTT